MQECSLEVTTVNSKFMAQCPAGSNPATPMVSAEMVKQDGLKIRCLVLFPVRIRAYQSFITNFK